MEKVEAGNEKMLKRGMTFKKKSIWVTLKCIFMTCSSRALRFSIKEKDSLGEKSQIRQPC